MRRYPAFAHGPVASKTLLERASQVVSCDYCHTRDADLERRKNYLATYDHCTENPKGGATKDKEPDTSWALFSSMYPGSRVQPDQGEATPLPDRPKNATKWPAFPEQVGVDGDPSWGDTFEENVKKRGGIGSLWPSE